MLSADCRPFYPRLNVLNWPLLIDSGNGLLSACSLKQTWVKLNQRLNISEKNFEKKRLQNIGHFIINLHYSHLRRDKMARI